jgi:hypothetical protein
MNDEMKRIAEEAFDATTEGYPFHQLASKSHEAIYAACDAVLAAQQMPVPGQVTESQILAAQMAWHQAELDGRVSIDSRDELRSRKIIEVIAPYVQYAKALEDAVWDAVQSAERALTELYPSEPCRAEHEAEYYAVNRVLNKLHAILSRRAPAEPAVQPLPRVQGDSQFGRSSVEPEAAQPDGELVDKMCREYYPHNIWGQLSRIEQGECRRNMTAALAVVRRAIEAKQNKWWIIQVGRFRKALNEAGLHGHYKLFQDYFGEIEADASSAVAEIEAQAREGYVPIEDVEKVFVRIPRASLRGRGSDERRKSSQKD